MTLQELGETIRNYRKRKKLSQKKLSDIVDIPVRTIQNVEYGENVGIEYIVKILEELDLEIAIKEKAQHIYVLHK